MEFLSGEQRRRGKTILPMDLPIKRPPRLGSRKASRSTPEVTWLVGREVMLIALLSYLRPRKNLLNMRIMKWFWTLRTWLQVLNPHPIERDTAASRRTASDRWLDACSLVEKRKTLRTRVMMPLLRKRRHSRTFMTSLKSKMMLQLWIIQNCEKMVQRIPRPTTLEKLL